MRVAKIETSKHKQERVLVFLEGEKDPLRLTQAELLRFGLFTGKEIGEDELPALRQAAHRSQVKADGARIASSAMVSRRDLQRKLTAKGATEDEAAETVQWLAELGAVDDSATAAAAVQHYARMGYGPGRIRQELQRRGIPRALWEDAMAHMPPSEEIIAAYLHAKKRDLSDPDQAKKTAAALARRGFSWNDIRAALRAAGQDWEETE